MLHASLLEEKEQRNNSGGGHIARKRAKRAKRASNEAQLSTFERTEARRWRIANSYNYRGMSHVCIQ